MAGLDASDEQAGRRPVETVRVELTPGWDASLTYDLLDHGARDGEQVFVGRREHLGPLVNAVGKPDRRGTYLVSGYRGAGKTSLIIQAVRLAKARLEEEGWKLLPVVLNVSEVSASLEPASEGKASPLQIDARRLLTAMLRALRNQVAPRDSSDELARKIRWAYAKAEATTYVETQQQRGEDVRTATREAKVGGQVADALKPVALLALLAAAAVEGIALLGSVVSSLHVVAAALAGVAAVSFSASWALTRTTTETATATEELVRDNSLHQLESELKDILQDLYDQHRRTVIVLEELDKIDDRQGQQLDSVIRYFKNLFTQAPALFFFITDKGYYDVVTERIQEARRRRSYAVEHTFFTHRLFVRRPGIDECLEYLAAIMASPADRAKVDDIARAQLSRVRDVESMPALEQVLRVLLFRSQDHFFDLKNELRQYVRVTPDGSWLECDEASMPRADRALAAFQFLVEQKARNNYFGGSRDYANEALKSCLFAVFDGLGSAEEQEAATFHPRLDTEGDQLSRSEGRRIVEAVDSLVEELQRGDAIQMLPPRPDLESGRGARFVWNSDAAERFRPVARLEEWEQALRHDLFRMAEVATMFGPGGRLEGGAGAPAEADAVAKRLRGRVRELQSSPAALPREDAASDRRAAEKELAPLVERAYHSHRQRLTEVYGVALQAEPGRPLEFVLSTAEQRRRPVILRYQQVGQRDDPAVPLPPLAEQPERVVVVEVTVDDALAKGQPQAGETVGNRALALRVPLHEDLEVTSPDGDWGMRTADELRFARLWCQYEPPDRADEEAARAHGGRYTLVTSADGPTTLPSLGQALSQWLRAGDEALVLSPDVGPPLIAVEQALMFERDLDTSPVVIGSLDKDPPRFFQGSNSYDLSEQDLAAVRRLSAVGRIVNVRTLDQREAEGRVRPLEKSGSVSSTRALLQAVAAPEWLPTVSVLHPEDSDSLAALVRLVRQRYPDHAISLLRPAADAGSVEAIRDLLPLLADRDPEAIEEWERRLEELAAQPSSTPS